MGESSKKHTEQNWDVLTHKNWSTSPQYIFRNIQLSARLRFTDDWSRRMKANLIELYIYDAAAQLRPEWICWANRKGEIKLFLLLILFDSAHTNPIHPHSGVRKKRDKIEKTRNSILNYWSEHWRLLSASLFGWRQDNSLSLSLCAKML